MKDFNLLEDVKPEEEENIKEQKTEVKSMEPILPPEVKSMVSVLPPEATVLKIEVKNGKIIYISISLGLRSAIKIRLNFTAKDKEMLNSALPQSILSMKIQGEK